MKLAETLYYAEKEGLLTTEESRYNAACKALYKEKNFSNSKIRDIANQYNIDEYKIKELIRKYQ